MGGRIRSRSERPSGGVATTLLEPSFRALAFRVLRVRSGPPPWDLRDDPRNASFRGRMVSAGLDLDPWLDGHQSMRIETDDGAGARIAIERDPIELLNMGKHFGTCLSPGGFNYFSVFSNIVDINKQVIYAKDESGRVLGRMLIALTDAGGLLTFHPYAHGIGHSFRAAAQEFVHGLAEAMGTLVVASGRISSLVTPSWYDDGPVDLTLHYQAFLEGSSFRRAIPELTPGRLITAVEEHLAPLPLNELTLPLVLALPEIEARPELLCTLFLHSRNVPLPGRALVRIAQQIGSSADSRLRRALAERLYRVGAVTPHHDEIMIDFEVADALLELDPPRVLLLLRTTRQRGIRRWSDEWDGYRLMLGAQAHVALHRVNKAKELYTLALGAELSGDSKKECRAALERLTLLRDM